MISAIGVVNNIQNVKVPAFRGKRSAGSNSAEDIFEATPRFVDGDLSAKKAESLINNARTPENFIGGGYTAHVFKTGNYAIKSPRNDFDDKKWLYISNQKIIKEYAILKEINAIAPDITAKPAALVKKDGVHHIIEEYIDGVHPYDMQLNEKHLSDLILKLTKLDKNGIFGSDLQSANMFFLKDGTARIIDFGSYSFLSDNGFSINSDYLLPEDMKNKGKIGLPEYAQIDIKNRYANSFLIKNDMDIIQDT